MSKKQICSLEKTFCLLLELRLSLSLTVTTQSKDINQRVCTKPSQQIKPQKQLSNKTPPQVKMRMVLLRLYSDGLLCFVFEYFTQSVLYS